MVISSRSMSVLDHSRDGDVSGIHVEATVGGFAVDVVRGDRQETVTVRGELDAATEPLLRAVLDTVLARSPSRVEVDLSAVTFLDATALTVLVAAQGRLTARRAVLVLRDPSPIVRRVLRLTGFQQLLRLIAEQQESGQLPVRRS